VLTRLLRGTKGAAAIEYAFLASMLAVSLVAVLLILGHNLDNGLHAADPGQPRRLVVRG
jgi:Flp pilus assembly pilin Flp